MALAAHYPCVGLSWDTVGRCGVEGTESWSLRLCDCRRLGPLPSVPRGSRGARFVRMGYHTLAYYIRGPDVERDAGGIANVVASDGSAHERRDSVNVPRNSLRAT